LYKEHRHLCIEGYSDSAYTWDKGDMKSTYGYCTYDMRKYCDL